MARRRLQVLGFAAVSAVYVAWVASDRFSYHVQRKAELDERKRRARELAERSVAAEQESKEQK